MFFGLKVPSGYPEINPRFTSFIHSDGYDDKPISVSSLFELALYAIPNSKALSIKKATSSLLIGLSKFK